MPPNFKRPSLPTKPNVSPTKSSAPTTKALPNPFSDSSTEIKKEGKFILIYSPPGEGKTTLAAQFPDPLFIITHGETGIHSAKRKGVAAKSIPVIELEPLYSQTEIPIGKGHVGWDKCISNVEQFAKGKHDRRTLVIDTTSGLESLCFQHCASLQFDGDMQSRAQDCWNHYAAGPRKAAESYWNGELLTHCINAVGNGLNVVMLGHSALRLQANPNGPDYNVFSPELQKQVFLYTNKVLHHLWFMGRYQEFTTEKGTRKRTVTSSERFIGVQTETWYTAKNWDNIQEPIICGDSAAKTFAAINSVIPID
jgi:hypothetical protein